MQFLFIPIPQAQAYSNPAAVSLLTVSNFAALAHTAVSSPLTGTVLNNGDLGIDAGCTDFPSPCTTPGTKGSVVNGAIQNENGVASTGQSDATAVVTDLNTRGVSQSITGGGLTGATLPQGVYDVTSFTTDLTGTLTLNGDANSIFIFRFNDTFITGSTAKVDLTGGAQACNVYWTSVAGTTFNDTTSMVGTVLAGTSVTFPGGGATLDGRVVAQTGALTFNNTTVNNSSCATAASNSTSGVDLCPNWAGFQNPVPAGASINDKGLCYDVLSAIAGSRTSITGSPRLPNAGIAPQDNNIPWYVPAGFLVGISGLLVLTKRKHRFSSRH